MIIGMPVFQNHAVTAQAIEALARTVHSPAFTLVIVDNGSPRPYHRGDYDVPFRLRVIRNEHNEGNFYPLRQVADLEPHRIVGLIHNDLIVHEAGWDARVVAAFRHDPQLGALGFVGSAGIDNTGFRDVTESNFRGTHGHARAEQIGTRVTGLRPAAAVDGLFMAFRSEALGALTLDRSLPPAHFYDLIWSAQVQLAGWRLATLGIECDHIGWQTEHGQAQALQGEWARWCREGGLDPGTDPMAVIRAYGLARWEALRGSFWPRSEPQGWT